MVGNVGDLVVGQCNSDMLWYGVSMVMTSKGSDNRPETSVLLKSWRSERFTCSGDIFCIRINDDWN
jgi:hypothetical protein